MSVAEFKPLDLNDALKQAEYFVWCGDSFSYDALWEIHVDKAKHPLKWVPHVRGFIGAIGPTTWLAFIFAQIEDHLVCFHYPTSGVVTRSEIEKYFEFTEKKCNAANFCNCINFLALLNVD